MRCSLVEDRVKMFLAQAWRRMRWRHIRIRQLPWCKLLWSTGHRIPTGWCVFQVGGGILLLPSTNYSLFARLISSVRYAVLCYVLWEKILIIVPGEKSGYKVLMCAYEEVLGRRNLRVIAGDVTAD